MKQGSLVLLVDDEDEFLEIASVKLERDGLKTVKAKGFRDALEKAESFLPDLILSDIYMPPGPSGWELALELHRNPKTRNIRFAFFTSLRDPWMELGSKQKAVRAELGSVTFFSKADDVDALAEKVSRLLT